MCFAQLTAAFCGSHSTLSVSDNYLSTTTNLESWIHAHDNSVSRLRSRQGPVAYLRRRLHFPTANLFVISYTVTSTGQDDSGRQTLPVSAAYPSIGPQPISCPLPQKVPTAPRRSAGFGTPWLPRMNDPCASCGASSSALARHSVLDTESSRTLWIPASAGMTNSRHAAGNELPESTQMPEVLCDHA